MRKPVCADNPHCKPHTGGNSLHIVPLLSDLSGCLELDYSTGAKKMLACQQKSYHSLILSSLSFLLFQASLKKRLYQVLEDDWFAWKKGTWNNI